MPVTGTQNPSFGETSCGSLLQQLQLIWDEVGERNEDRDKIMHQLEQECLHVYKSKIDQALKSRALLLQELADSKSKLTTLLSSLGEKTCIDIPEKSRGTIKEQLAAITPALEHLRKLKERRLKEFADIQLQIQNKCAEIAGSMEINVQVGTPTIDENDLSLQKLGEFHFRLQELQKEKSKRLHKVLDFAGTIHDLCADLGMDFFSTITEVNPSLNDSLSKIISNDTLSKLARTAIELAEDKKLRLQKIDDDNSMSPALAPKQKDAPIDEPVDSTPNISYIIDDENHMSPALAPNQKDAPTDEPIDISPAIRSPSGSARETPSTSKSSKTKRKAESDDVKTANGAPAKKLEIYNDSKSSFVKDAPSSSSKASVPSKASTLIPSRSWQSASVAPVSEDEIRVALRQVGPITTRDFISRYRERLKSEEDESALLEILRRLSKGDYKRYIIATPH